MNKGARRIVTGHDPTGKSIILSDAQRPPLTAARRPGVEFVELWNTQADPAPISAQEAREPTERPVTLGPGAHGSMLRFVDFHPHAPGETGPVPPFMHRTETVDYGLVLQGQIYLMMDDTETLLHQGDVVIQRGTNHAWHNRSNAVCRMAFILLSGKLEPELLARLPNIHLVP